GWATAEERAAANTVGRRGGSIATVLKEALPTVLGLVLLLSAWEAWVRLGHVKPYLVPAPSRVAERLGRDPDLFLREGLHTLEGAVLGFALGATVAVSLAALMSQSRFLERAIFPLAILVKVTPIIAVAPLLTI